VSPRTSSRTKAPKQAPSGRGRPPRREREVVDAAAKVFARRGYAAATVQDVADELGILKGSLYYYIKTKEDLLLQLLNEVHDEVDALLAEVKQSDEQDPMERLALYVRTQTEYNLNNLVKVSIYYNDIDQLSEERRKSVLRRRKVHEDFVIDLVLDGQRKGTIAADADPRLLAYSVFATVIWPYRWYRPRGRIKLDAVVDACVDFVMHGVAKR
jgi:AcrR family transcriptional regulator